VSEHGIRVLRIIDRLNVGGPTKHVTWLSAGLAEHGFDTTLVTGTIAPGEGDMTWFAHANGVRPVVVPAMSRALRPADVRVAWRLYRVMREVRPDVVHTHKAKAGAVGRAAALLYRWGTPAALVGRPRRVRVVHTFHGHVFHGYYGRLASRLFVAVERALARLATDRVVTISRQQREEIVGRYRVGTAARSTVIPLGLDVPVPASLPARRLAVRAELGVADGELLVVAVGRLCEVKNHALLLDAVARARHDGLPVRLALVGDGHLRAALEARARELGIADAVRFVGFVDDPTGHYAAADVVALGSVNEGTPLTLLEAMACARCVAATAVGGVVDILGRRRREHPAGVVEWDHGTTVASGDAAAFAASLRLLAADPARRRRMGEQGRAFVRDAMSREGLVARTAALYRAVMDGTSGGEADEGLHHGRSGVHRVASRGAVSLAR
jgi:glycosyltransferase involved in cell wall biosynthesis